MGLWFDVERRYKTIGARLYYDYPRLWFDVERRYKTIIPTEGEAKTGCGLM